MKFLGPTSALVGSALFVMSSALGASAADLGPYRAYEPPPEPVIEQRVDAPIWDGAYIGANLGYSWGSNDFTSPEGIVGGGQLGWNWQRGNLVFGVEGDIQAADYQQSVAGFGNAASTDIDWYSTLRARAGVAAGPLLFYGTGGFAFANIDNSLLIGGPNPAALSDSGWQTGYAVGGGVEWAVARNWSIKAEYLYLDFGDQTISGSDSFGTPVAADVHNDMQTLRLGVNYKF